MKIYKIAKEEVAWDQETAERYVEIENEERSRILNEFSELKKKRKAKPNTQPWTVIPAARLIKIWNDYATWGIVRDERGLNEIADKVIRNTARLAVNTEIVGHTEMDASKEYAEDYEYYGIKSEKDKEKLMEYIQDDKFSDYALKPLGNIVAQLIRAKTAEEKLLLIDQALNVVHQRGDIAAVFVEGGQRTLNQLFERKTMAFNLYLYNLRKKAAKQSNQ